MWNVRGASDVKSPQLVREARFIQGALGRGDKAVWKRVVVVVNMSLAKGGGFHILRQLILEHTYRLTYHVVQNLLLTSKQKFRFCHARPG